MNLERALAAEAKLIVCDEITSTLDTVEAKAILNLLHDRLVELSIVVLKISAHIAIMMKLIVAQ